MRTTTRPRVAGISFAKTSYMPGAVATRTVIQTTLRDRPSEPTSCDNQAQTDLESTTRNPDRRNRPSHTAPARSETEYDVSGKILYCTDIYPFLCYAPGC